jgi:radical SAM superfamily enzyme YgiQ (UPF0313 family)
MVKREGYMRIAFVNINLAFNISRGAGYMVAVIKKTGHTVDYYDTQLILPHAIVAKVIEGNYDVVLVSSMTIGFSLAEQMAAELKKRNPKVKIVLGGIHATVLCEQALLQNEWADYACVGEGEEMIPALLSHINGDLPVHDVPNLVYRDMAGVRMTAVAPPTNLALLPDFPWELYPRNWIVQPKTGFCYVTATRGCPYNCYYCCNGVNLKLYGVGYLRARPAEQVVKELSFLRDTYHPSLFYFGDEMMLRQSKYCVDLFTRIYKEVKVPYGFMARPEHINAGIIGVMKNTGCKYVAMGVECGDEKFRRTVLNRKTSDKEIVEAFRLCREAGIFTTAFNMIGYPYPIDDELTKSTIWLLKEAKPDFSQVTAFYPLPGTPMFAHCLEYGLIDAKKVQTGYYDSSILIDKPDIGKWIDIINRELNPNGFVFQI